jgi:hypothetical protein
MLTHSMHPVHGAGTFPFGEVLPANFGWGITPDRFTGIAVGMAALVAIAFALRRVLTPSLRPTVGTAERLVVGGIIVVVLGALPFARDGIDPVGLCDRANAVTSLGAAAVWVGLGMMAWRRRAAGLAATVVVAGLMTATHLRQDVDYARAGRDSDRVVAAVRAAFPRPPRGVVLVGPAPPYHHGVVGTVGTVEPLVQTVLDDQRYHVEVPEDPARFANWPVQLRLDVFRSAP